MLLRRWWKLVVVLPLACAAVCLVVLIAMPSQYQAKAVLSVSTEVSAIGGIAELAANTESDGNTNVSVAVDTSKKRLTITATGNDAKACIAAANNTATLTKADASSMYDKASIDIAEASNAKDVSPSVAKYVFSALLGGLFAACCLVMAWDMWRRPIKSMRDLAEVSGLRVLGTVSLAEKGKGLSYAKLAANIGFIADGKKTVCLVPADTSVDVGALHVALMPEILEQKIRFEIEAARPLSESEAAAYTARAAGATILVANEWTTSQHAVEESIDDLSIAGASLAGAILLETGER